MLPAIFCGVSKTQRNETKSTCLIITICHLKPNTLRVAEPPARHVKEELLKTHCDWLSWSRYEAVDYLVISFLTKSPHPLAKAYTNQDPIKKCFLLCQSSLQEQSREKIITPFGKMLQQIMDMTRCKITALKGFLYTDGPFRAVSRTVQIFNNMGRQKSRQNFTFL